MLTVQVVEILWTKATRGAPRALERVSLPRAFPVDSPPGNYVVQRYRLAEWEDFQPQLLKTETFDNVRGTEGVLRITFRDGAFSLGVSGTPRSGQPKRRALPDAIELSAGQFARLVLNARHTSYSGQYYSETIYNVACGDVVPADRFLSGKPDHDIDLKANLF
ncbi:MAG TPA: hypothetical protein VIN03_00920 [Roseateles sp.]